MAYEVLDASINVHLNDQDAIRGVERLRTTVKRNVKAIGREKAIVNIEGNLRELKKDLKEAKALVARNEKEIKALGKAREEMSDKEVKAADARIKALRAENKEANKRIPVLSKTLDSTHKQYQYMRQIHQTEALVTKELREQQKLHDGINKTLKDDAKLYDAAAREDSRRSAALQAQAQAMGKLHSQALKMDDARNKSAQQQEQTMGKMHAQALKMDAERAKSAEEYAQRQGQLQARAEREMEAEFKRRADLEKKRQAEEQRTASKMEAAHRKATLTHAAALKEDIERQATINKLQQAYNKAYQENRRLTAKRSTVLGRAREAASPAIQQEVELRQAGVLAEMEVLRAKLMVMGRDPIEIETHLDRGNMLAKLANIGDVGMRLGPFAGTVSQFGKALLALGPIVTGLVGYLGALTGAVGAGLTGAVGLGSAALAGFGLSLGGVGMLIPSLLRDFKHLNSLQDTYRKRLLELGPNAEKTQTALEKYKHALGAVSDTTRKAFDSLDSLQDRWRGMSKAARPAFFDALGSAINMADKNFDLFSKHTLDAFGKVSKGFQEWMRGLSSHEGQVVIEKLMTRANAAIPPLMHGLGQLGAAFGRMAASFARYLAPEFTRFDKWATSLNNAASGTRKLDGGVDNMMKSFHQLWSVLTATGRVLKEFMFTAMGPGGDAMQNLADGLNGIADAIAADRAGDNKLGKFLKESVGTVDRLYNAIQPLLKLFIEFTTIMRPFTDALLSIIGPITEVTESFLSLEPVRKSLQLWAALWLFNRGTSAILTNVASSMNLVAKAMAALAGSKLLTKLGPVGRALGLTAAAAGAGASNIARRGATGGAAAQGALGGAAGGGAASLLSRLGKTGATKAAGGLVARAGAPAAGAAVGSLGKNLLGGLGGSMLTGLARASVWGMIGVSAFKGIKTGFKKGIDQGAMEMASSLTFGLLPKPKDYAEIDKAGQKVADRVQKMAAQIKREHEMGITVHVDLDSAKFNANKDIVLDSMERIRATTVTSIGQARSSMKQNFELMSKYVNIHGEEGKKMVASSYRSMAASIKRGMDRGLIDVRKGTAEMHSYLLRALAALGIKGRANQEGYLATQDARRSSPKNTTSGDRNAANQAATGYIGREGARGMDMVPLMVGRGEAVLNRHQQRWVNAGLQAIGVDGLPDLFERESTPHYMNRGGFTGAARGAAPVTKPRIPRKTTNIGGMYGQQTQGTLDMYRKGAQTKANQAWRAYQSEVMDTGESSTTGLTSQVKRAISWARRHGWHGTVTSGFRSYGEQAVLYARYLAGGNIAAKPGSSNHESGRAIDVTDHDAFNRAMLSAPANSRLKWYGPGDAVHFSIDGHARGGFAGASRGSLPSRTLSSVLKKAPGLSSFNKIYKRGSKEALDPQVIRAIAEAVGFSPTEALHMSQIAHGESMFQPGAVSNDGGFGLMQNTPRAWGPAAKAYMAKLGGENALFNPIFSLKMAKYLADDRRKQGKDPLGPWFGTKYLRRNSRAKRSVLPDFSTRGAKGTTEKRIHGMTMDVANLLALDESNFSRAGRSRNDYDDVWTAGVLAQRLSGQNRSSRARIKDIDKRLKRKLTPTDRSSLLSERAGLIGQIESNRSRVADLKTNAKDALFEAQRGPHGNKLWVDYQKSIAESTVTLSDDLEAAKAEQTYYAERIKFLKENKGTRAQITEATNSYNAATGQVKDIQESIASDWLGAMGAMASLTMNLDDDLWAANQAKDYAQAKYDLAVATNDTAGIAKWGSDLKSAGDTVTGIKEDIDLLPLRAGEAKADLTDTLDDDLTWAEQFRDYWQGKLDVANASGDLAGQINAATNLKPYLDKVKGIKEQISNDPNLQAQLDKAKEKLNIAESAAAINARAVMAFGSYGDIGTAVFSNAYNAARYEAAPYAQAPAPTIIIQTLHPGDPATLDAIGQAATGGIGLQGSVISPRVVTGV